MSFPFDSAGAIADPQADVHLLDVFNEINALHFDGFLTAPALRWNSRLRSSAGRFVPGSRKWFREHPPTIEVATYLKSENEAETHIRDTIAHEMIHYWLWVRRRPYGHTDEFYAKMELMGVSRYNPVPRVRAPKYLYFCPGCSKKFETRRRIRPVACSDCCNQYAGGVFDARFSLILAKEFTPRERGEWVREKESQKKISQQEKMGRQECSVPGDASV